MRAERRQRRLALGVLLAAAGLAVLALPFRATWWGGWVLAVAEAGVVGGLADWFAVTALFRRPLGLPIPHTALIPANWELLAARVGTMVGSRVLTKEYVTQELARLDVAALLATAAERVSRDDLEAVVRALARWLAGELPAAGTADLVARLRDLLLRRPLAPALAAALEVARRHRWDERLTAALAEALVAALDRPAFRAVVAELVDELLLRYRERVGAAPRFWIGLASLFGFLDRDRLVAALHAGLRQVAADPAHPLRRRLAEAVEALPRRLREDRALAARVDAALRDLLGTPAAARVLEDAAAAVHRALVADLARPASDVVAWTVARLDRARRALGADAALRADIDRWAKARVADALERHHARLAGFIEKGVLALGPEGAVRLVEEHAGDDLQYIRVNGTVVGGLAGGAIYAIHLLLRLL
ncbi:MAG: hypothetical protein A3G44_05340 [Candidatus Rokubacteria bacterium RIFCSPLOWO2_12_FULL_73_47]|nr:MAG: hypothetical protein A3G44_05340 [Candidatus Rokubacteria bacterium RIFCSPLOWO2_12_FULL_73_47]